LHQLMPAAADEDSEDRFRSIGWLNRFASRPLHIDEVENALVDSFIADLGFHLEPDEPTMTEFGVAQRLCAEWYGNREWTLAGPGIRSRQPAAVGD
ncbi:MAG: hypothetical protein NDI73_11355, partial [Desulfuromonadales bacterium]|nr:hypothetical protein [Desulfuromonadales bacterium]